MLYKVGTARDLSAVLPRIPQAVIGEVVRDVLALDRAYGINRNPLEIGGFVLIAETCEDMAGVRNLLDYERHPCEWASYIGESREYLSALYVLNNDFSIALCVPTAIAPDNIIKELEETK